MEWQTAAVCINLLPLRISLYFVLNLIHKKIKFITSSKRENLPNGYFIDRKCLIRLNLLLSDGIFPEGMAR